MDKHQEISSLTNLATALATAVNMRFMSLEHGALIWKEYLKQTSIDINKPKLVIRKESNVSKEN